MQQCLIDNGNCLNLMRQIPIDRSDRDLMCVLTAILSRFLLLVWISMQFSFKIKQRTKSLVYIVLSLITQARSLLAMVALLNVDRCGQSHCMVSSLAYPYISFHYEILN